VNTLLLSIQSEFFNELRKQKLIFLDPETEELFYILKSKTDIYFNKPKGPFACLSNIYETSFYAHEKSWRNIDYFLLAIKITAPYFVDLVRTAETLESAKDISDKRQNMWREDWDNVYLLYMKEAIIEKFNQNNNLKQILNSTKPHNLIYDNKEDPILGIGQGDGQNLLGKMLMEIRDHKKQTVKQ